MGMKKARERLERHVERRDEIKSMIEKYQDTRLSVMSCSGIKYDKPKIQASPGDWITKKIVEVTDFEKAIKKERAKFEHEAEALSQEINKLENRNEREVLLRYYLRNESANNISKSLNINRTSVFRIMRRAESHIDALPHK